MRLWIFFLRVLVPENFVQSPVVLLAIALTNFSSLSWFHLLFVSFEKFIWFHIRSQSRFLKPFSLIRKILSSLLVNIQFYGDGVMVTSSGYVVKIVNSYFWDVWIRIFDGHHVIYNWVFVGPAPSPPSGANGLKLSTGGIYKTPIVAFR